MYNWSSFLVVDKAQLIVRNIDMELVSTLEERANEHGISVKEEHRRILHDALCPKDPKKPSFIEHLKTMPEIPDEFLARSKDLDREIEL